MKNIRNLGLKFSSICSIDMNAALFGSTYDEDSWYSPMLIDIYEEVIKDKDEMD